MVKNSQVINRIYTFASAYETEYYTYHIHNRTKLLVRFIRK